MTMPSVTVAISQEFEPRATNGRTATRSTTTPQSAQAASASTIARVNGQPSVTQNVKQTTAPSIMVEPWAKFTVRRHRVGDMKAQREQSIHAAEAESGNDRGRNQHRELLMAASNIDRSFPRKRESRELVVQVAKSGFPLCRGAHRAFA